VLLLVDQADLSWEGFEN